jgi:hypothetical protein
MRSRDQQWGAAPRELQTAERFCAEVSEKASEIELPVAQMNQQQLPVRIKKSPELRQKVVINNEKLTYLICTDST